MFDYDLYKSRCKELVSAIQGLGIGYIALVSLLNYKPCLHRV